MKKKTTVYSCNTGNPPKRYRRNKKDGCDVFGKTKRSSQKQKKTQWFNKELVFNNKSFADPVVFESKMSFLIEPFNILLSDISKLLPNDMYSLADLRYDQDLVRNLADGIGTCKLICVEIPRFISEIMLYLETDDPAFSDFFSKADNGWPIFLSGLTKYLTAGGISCKLETDLIAHLYQIGSMFKKLKGPYGKEVLVEFTKEFVRVDNELREFHPRYHDPELQDIILHATREAQAVLKDFGPYDPYSRDLFIPRPGPGGVAILTRKSQRFRPNVLHRSVNSVLPYTEWLYLTFSDACLRFKRLRRLFASAVDEPISRFEVVPKNFSKPRGMCLEENEMQVLQQAFRRALYYWLEVWHPLTRGRVMFTDQEAQGTRALEASICQDRDTLDMSDGSNRVSHRLCFHFYGETEIWPYINALSTKAIAIKDPLNKENVTIHRNAMYAPMGSALCFPIMGLTHYLLCRAIIATKLPPQYRKNMDQVYVYGDDIICSHDVTEAIFQWLPKFGMKLNVSKSYRHSFFRESCGVHAYKGRDITPVYVRDVPHIEFSPISTLHSAVAAERGFHDRGYFSVAKWFRVHVHSLLGESLPKVWEKSPEFGWTRAERQDVDLQRYTGRKWDSDLQEITVRIRASRSNTDKCFLPQREALLRYLWMNPKQQENVVKEDPRDTFQWVRVPHSAL